MNYQRNTIVAGTVAGIVGGICMALILMVQSAVVGLGFWLPLQLSGALFYGVTAILGGSGPAISGLLLYLVVSAGLGALFGAMIRPSATVSQAVGQGMVFGLVTWAVMSYLIIPIVNTTMSNRIALIPGWWFVSCMAFGAVLGATPAIRRAIVRSERVILRRSDDTSTRRVA